MAKSFPSKYVYTAGDPSSSGPVPAGVGIAIQVGAGGATDAQIADFIKKHPDNPIILWEQEGSQAIVDATNKYHPAGVIIGGESPEQVARAAAIGGQLNVPKVIESTANYSAKWPPGYGAAFAYYKNQDMPTLSPQNLADFLATAISEGATSIQVTLGSYGDAQGNMAQYQADLAKALAILKSKGIDTSNIVISVYRWDEMTQESKDAFMKVNATPAAGASQGATGSQVSQKPKAKKKPKGAGEKKPDPAPELGIQHEKPLSAVKSHGYKGEDDPRLTYSYTDKAKNDNTLTFRPNGIVVQTKEDGTSFVVWDPSKHNGQHWPGFQNQKIKDPYDGVTFNEDANSKVSETVKTPTGAGTPAWHVNPGWKGLDEATKAALKSINGIDQSQILEEREGANSNIVIFRMADGTYKSLDVSTGQVAGAGTWAKDQWNSTGYGPEITGGGSNTSSSSSSSSSSSQNENGNNTTVLGEYEQSNSSGQKVKIAIELKENGKVKLKSADGTTLKTFDNRESAAKELLAQAEAGVKPESKITIEDGPSTSSIVIPSNRSPLDVPASVTDTFIGDPNAHGSCFPAGSLVLVAGGHHKAIEEIKLGDLVKTWNFREKRMEETEVTDVLAHYQKATLILSTDRGHIVTTPEHPFWNGKDWVPANKLGLGTKIYHQIGELCEITSVEDGPTRSVYNFHVTSPAHNYFVNGFLVHNMKMLQ